MNIEKTVCDYYEVTIAEVQSGIRKRRLSLPRHMIAYQYYKFTTLKVPEIAKVCGFDRTSYYNAVKSINDGIDTDMSIREDVLVIHDLIQDTL